MSLEMPQGLSETPHNLPADAFNKSAGAVLKPRFV
jgi:hypothetical protein